MEFGLLHVLRRPTGCIQVGYVDDPRMKIEPLPHMS